MRSGALFWCAGINAVQNIVYIISKYLKIKEAISKCGNTVIEIEEKEECKKILYSFLNSKIYLENKEEKIWD